MSVRRLILGLLITLLGSSAFALVQPGYQWTTNMQPLTWRASAAEACADWVTYYQANGKPGNWATYTMTTNVCDSSTNPGVWRGTPSGTLASNGSPVSGAQESRDIFRNSSLQCPANSTAVTGGCQCASGYDESGGQCVQNQCSTSKGSSTLVNWTAGWQRTNRVTSTEPLINANPLPASPSACVAGCTVNFDAGSACPGCKAQVSQTPNDQGLYRVNVEFIGIGAGTPCSMSTTGGPTLPDDAKDPPCPGYVGEINGQKGCYGTAEKPIKPVPNTITQGRDTVPGNPPAGAPSGPGNPTPTNGAGGSAGGPAGAGVGPAGSGGTGTVAGAGNGSGRVGTQGGTEQQNCGAPGQPSCKIDETGTPEKGDYSTVTKGIDDTGKSLEDAIKLNRDRTDGPTWSFSFAFPTGCAPLDTHIGGVVMNPCEWQPMIHDLLSMVWVAVTVFTCIGMVGRAIQGT